MRLNLYALLAVLLSPPPIWEGRLMKASVFVAIHMVAFLLFASAHAVTISTVPVGHSGNPADHTGFGSVGYNYRIGTTEVINAQYTEFLNGIDPTGANTLALYNTSMSTNARGGINFNALAANGSKYEIKPGRDNNPVVFVSWYDSIRFANWLHNGQGSGDTENGAYTLGALGAEGIPLDVNSITRNAGARWWLPSEDEWYKAAYHKNDGVTGNYWLYPTSTSADPYSDQPPGSDAPDPSNTANFYKDDRIANGYDDGYAVTGSVFSNSSQNYLTDVGAYTLSISPYGTFDQGGNASEWNDTLIPSTCFSASCRGFRGGAWFSFLSDDLLASRRIFTFPAMESFTSGFRVASIPEPAPLELLMARIDELVLDDLLHHGIGRSLTVRLMAVQDALAGEQEHVSFKMLDSMLHQLGALSAAGRMDSDVAGELIAALQAIDTRSTMSVVAVPEPSSFALLTVAGVALLRRHRSRRCSRAIHW